MKITSLLVLSLLAGCGAVEEDPQIIRQENLGGGGGGVQGPPQHIDLTQDSVEPAQPIESRPVYVHFTLSNSTKVARSGTVSAEVDTGDYPPTLTSSVWSTGTIPAYSNISGVVEFRPNYAGTVTYRLHYYENGVASESNATGASLIAGLRADFDFEYVQVDDAADSVLGDQATAFFNVSRNGTQVSNNSIPLGVMHDHSAQILAPPPRYHAELVPGSGDTVSIDSGVVISPWFFGSPFYGAFKNFQWTAEAVKTLIPNQTYSQSTAPESVSSMFCGGWEYTGNGSCPAGTNSDYLLLWTVTRLHSTVDTVQLTNFVVQVPANSWYFLDSASSGVGYSIQSGGGAIANLFGGLYYRSPGGVGIDKIAASDSSGRAATLEIGYQ